ncbi:MAG: bifunctional molybdenum cofactor biosynthesis protein MoaC/MoaB [Omnitrophica bacterium RIFCSPLOWO2_01_FULL_45_10b]|nr:MAG: bifunctional molybdenum cofactor biosynthesis protein MoaC/MoaB [Omnitrophica bacterium RIFCSPLOWO2_01_FULL_45_10b]
MKSVTEKTDTLREAVAMSIVLAKPETLERLKANDLPKKDALAVARAAGVMAAKKTSELIPYCHPIPIDSVEIDFEIQADRVIITASVETVWKTGIEMEALTAASVAALTIYDMLKPVDRELEIVSTKLVEKKGGKSDRKEWVPKGFSAAVIITSDGTYKGTREDKSGKIIKERLEAYGISPSYEVLPDDQQMIAAKLKELCDQGVLLILTTGGTGLGPRDVTVEATRQVMDREIPGIMEACRVYGQRRTPYSMLSRGLAAQRGNALMINLPGSSNGVRESLNAIFPAVLHSYQMMDGLGHPLTLPSPRGRGIG